MPAGRVAKYPFAELEIGQSFTLPAGEGMNFTNMRAYVCSRSKVLGRAFAAEELPGGAVRVRRIHPSERFKRYTID